MSQGARAPGRDESIYLLTLPEGVVFASTEGCRIW